MEREIPFYPVSGMNSQEPSYIVMASIHSSHMHACMLAYMHTYQHRNGIQQRRSQGVCALKAQQQSTKPTPAPGVRKYGLFAFWATFIGYATFLAPNVNPQVVSLFFVHLCLFGVRNCVCDPPLCASGPPRPSIVLIYFIPGKTCAFDVRFYLFCFSKLILTYETGIVGSAAGAV